MAQRNPPQIPRDVASQILDRAARIDADEHLDLTSLRSAATDAGINPEAFDRALAEMIASRVQPPAPAEPDRSDRFEIATKSGLIGAAAGTLSIALVSLMVGDMPPSDALLGALIGGGGAVLGIVTYLLNRRR